MSKSKKGKTKRPITVPEAFSAEPKIEMLGNREIIIDGCNGVVEYDENIIKLNTGTLVIGITGADLIIRSFDNNVAVICGKIVEISFVS